MIRDFRIPIEELDSARSKTSALTPSQAIGWALVRHELPDGTIWTVQEQAEMVLRFLEDSGYRVIAKEDE